MRGSPSGSRPWTGSPTPVTMDYREDRINAEVEADKVVRVTIG